MNPTNNVVSLHLKNQRLVPEKARALADALTHPNNRLEIANITLDYVDSPSLGVILSVLNHPNCKLTTLNVIGASRDVYAEVRAVLASPDCHMKEIKIGSNALLADPNVIARSKKLFVMLRYRRMPVELVRVIATML